MRRTVNRVDSIGQPIATGDPVILREVPEYLVRDLPLEEQDAIRLQKGKTFEIASFDDQGYVELEFSDDQQMLHTIWVKPSCLEKQP